MIVISSEKAPAAIGPYSQAILTDGVLFTSGQIPLDPKTGVVAGTGIETQTEQVMQNLAAVLQDAGMGFENVVKTTCYMQQNAPYLQYNRLFSQHSQTPCRRLAAQQQDSA